MIEDNEMIKIKNRSKGSLGYRVADLGNLRRYFEIGEVKSVPMLELRKLSYTNAGREILKDCLMINNKEAAEELLAEVEPEYFYEEEDLLRILNEGSLDEFLDCLDFAPEGTIDIIKKLAVETKLNDISKREALLEKTGFNVTNALRIEKESIEESAEVKEETSSKRRVPQVKQRNVVITK